MCEFLIWALKDFNIPSYVYKTMTKKAIKIYTEEVLNTSDKDKSTLRISQNVLLNNKTKKVHFAPCVMCEV